MSLRGPEHAFSVTPAIDALVAMDYAFIPREQAELGRDGLNQVILRDEFLKAVQRLNKVSKDVARAAYNKLLGVQDIERWSRILRGDYSRTVPGRAEKNTIKLIDFLHRENNTFTGTEELTVCSANYAPGRPGCLRQRHSSSGDRVQEPAFAQGQERPGVRPDQAVRAGNPAPFLLQRLLDRDQRCESALRRDRCAESLVGHLERPLAAHRGRVCQRMPEGPVVPARARAAAPHFP